MKKLIAAVLLSSSLALAAPPAGPPMKGGPGHFKDADEDGIADRVEERERKVRMALVVGAAEALQLTEAEALKLSEKLKAFDEKRRPVRQQMFESMKTLKAAADGEQAALAAVDQAVQKVLDGRQQLAAIDKEMFSALAQGQPPQKKARLALFLARAGQELQKLRAGGGRGGRFRAD